MISVMVVVLIIFFSVLLSVVYFIAFLPHAWEVTNVSC